MKREIVSLLSGISSTIPLFNRNEGPIAEAEARRKEAAALFLQTQAQVIAKSERALAVYQRLCESWLRPNPSINCQETQLQIVQQAIRAGAENRLSLDGVRIQLSVLARAKLDALGRAQRALGDLEDAVQRPLSQDGLFQITPESPALIGSTGAPLEDLEDFLIPLERRDQVSAGNSQITSASRPIQQFSREGETMFACGATRGLQLLQ